LSKLKSASSQTWPRLALVGAILVLWWLVYALGIFSSAVLPSPLSVWNAFTSNLTGSNGLAVATSKSLVRLAVGMGVAVVIGTAIGLAMASWKPIQRSVGTLTVALQAIPSIAWLSLALIWLGQRSAQAIIWIVIIGAFPSVAIATANSVRLVPRVLVHAGRTLGATGWELQRGVIFPAAIPGYFAGARAGPYPRRRGRTIRCLTVAGDDDRHRDRRVDRRSRSDGVRSSHPSAPGPAHRPLA
jgi:NitT/TauT family transport system permease protein